MGWEDRITEYLTETACLPAVGQGALGIECREDDEELLHLLQLYNDPQTAFPVQADAVFSSVLNGGCRFRSVLMRCGCLSKMQIP